MGMRTTTAFKIDEVVSFEREYGITQHHSRMGETLATNATGDALADPEEERTSRIMLSTTTFLFPKKIA